MNLYYPSPCIQMPGPPEKVYPEQNTCEGVILHSAEGYRPGLESQLRDAQVSWHFTVYQDGTVEQHYPVTASCWHAGSAKQNRRLIGVEHEGVAGEPLTEAQADASVRLVGWLASNCGWAVLMRGVNLFEHREVNPQTQCPSGRIPWERYTASPDLPAPTIEDVAAFWQAVANPATRPDVDVDPIPPSRPGWRAFRVEIKED